MNLFGTDRKFCGLLTVIETSLSSNKKKTIFKKPKSGVIQSIREATA